MIEAIIGFFGVMVGSFVVIANDAWTSRLKRRSEGSYSAIRLFCILEEYGDQCIDVVYDDGMAYGRPAGKLESGEEYCKAQVPLPEPLNFPEDIIWRILPALLMNRILALPNKAKSTNKYINASSEHAFPPDYEELFDARQRGYAHLGLDALKIAEDLRKEFHISVQSRATLNSNCDPLVFLRDKIATLRNNSG